MYLKDLQLMFAYTFVQSYRSHRQQNIGAELPKQDTEHTENNNVDEMKQMHTLN